MRKPINHEGMGQPAPEEEEVDIDNNDGGVLTGKSTDDVCKTLLDRYVKSSAPQHRHLCASACAMRSILTEEGLPLTPPAYLAAVIATIRDADHNDRDGVAALSAFLSILLPVVDVKSFPSQKAKDACSTVVNLLQADPDGLATVTVRSLVKCLGFLVLCLDLDDWDATKTPFGVLLKFSVDQRPKVRKCSQVSFEKVFSVLTSSRSIKKAGIFLLSMYKSCISLYILEEPNGKGTTKSHHTDVLHYLNVIALIIPKLPRKTTVKFLHETYKLLRCRSLLFSQHVLKLLDVLLEHLNIDDLINEVEEIVSSISSYVSPSENNSADVIISASNMFRKILNKLHPSKEIKLTESFPLVFKSLAGLLNSKGDTAKDAADILEELITCHISQDIFPVDAKLSSTDALLDSPELAMINSICALLENMICSNSVIPNEHILKVISKLFLKLGEISHFFMQNILLKLSQWAVQTKALPESDHLHECIGSAVIAMGAEKMLSLFPVSLDEEKLICSNLWLIPILRKYVSGASLQFFMENIAPLTKSICIKCKKVKRPQTLKTLRSCKKVVWSLLPAFCHYSKDTHQNFDALSQFLKDALKDDPSTHEAIAAALQMLVKENQSMLKENEDGKRTDGVNANEKNVECVTFNHCYSKKTASKNIKAMARCSKELVQTIIDSFMNYSSEKCLHLKEVIECLSSVMGSSDLEKFVVSLSRNLEFGYTVSTPEDSTGHKQPTSELLSNLNEKQCDEKNRHMSLHLVSCFVAAADKDLIYRIYGYAKHALVSEGDSCRFEAYMLLCKILKEHSWFSFKKADELIALLTGVKTQSDVNILRSRFSCFHFLLVSLLKNGEQKAKEKAFTILNEIILTLKDSNKDVRKTAYDMLFAIASHLKDTHSGSSDSPLHDLLTMIMGYFSGSPPQIKSGAVAALSLLIYKNADLCLSVHNLLPSALALLKRKENEVIKAVLGFVKVLVSSLNANDLTRLLPDIASATLPWSVVSKFHFKSKVKMIFEIILRKCGADSVNMVVPEKYRGFIKTVEEQRQNRTTSKDDSSSDPVPMQVDSLSKGAKKRKSSDTPSNDKRYGQENNKNKKSFYDKGGRYPYRKNGANSSFISPPCAKYSNKRMKIEGKPSMKVEKMKANPKHNNKVEVKFKGKVKKMKDGNNVNHKSSRSVRSLGTDKASDTKR